MNDIEKRALKVVKARFYKGAYVTSYILFPEQSTFDYPDFNPYRAVQTVISVNVPAIVNMHERVLTFNLSENDLNQGF